MTDQPWEYEMSYDNDDLHAAIVMLHEQAHGPTPIRTCTQEPCMHVRDDVSWTGPAPLTLVGVGR